MSTACKLGLESTATKGDRDDPFFSTLSNRLAIIPSTVSNAILEDRGLRVSERKKSATMYDVHGNPTILFLSFSFFPSFTTIDAWSGIRPGHFVILGTRPVRSRNFSGINYDSDTSVGFLGLTGVEEDGTDCPDMSRG